MLPKQRKPPGQGAAVLLNHCFPGDLVPPSGPDKKGGAGTEIFGKVHQEERLSSPFYALWSKQGFEGQEAAAGKGDVLFLPSGFFRDAITLLLQPDSAKITCTSPRDCGVRDLSAADTPTQPLGSFYPRANSSSLELGHLPV